MSSRFKKDFPFYENCSIRTEFTTDTTWDEVVKESQAGEKVGFIWDPRRQRYKTDKERRQDLSDADRDNLEELRDLGYTPENYMLGLVAQLASLSSRRRGLEVSRGSRHSTGRGQVRTPRPNLTQPSNLKVVPEDSGSHSGRLGLSHKIEEKLEKEHTHRKLQRSQTTVRGDENSNTFHHANGEARDETQLVMERSKIVSQGLNHSQSSREADNRLRKEPQLRGMRRSQTTPREAGQHRRSRKTANLPRSGYRETEGYWLQTVQEETHAQPACQANATHEPQAVEVRCSMTTTDVCHLNSSRQRHNKTHDDHPNKAEGPRLQKMPLGKSRSWSSREHNDGRLRNEYRQVQGQHSQDESRADTYTLSPRQVDGDTNDPVPIIRTSYTARGAQNEHSPFNLNYSKSNSLDTQATTRDESSFEDHKIRREAFQSSGQNKEVLRSHTTQDKHYREAFPRRVVVPYKIDPQQRIAMDDIMIEDDVCKALEEPYTTTAPQSPQQSGTSQKPRPIDDSSSSRKVRKLLSSESLAKDVMIYMTYIGSDSEEEASKDFRNNRTKFRGREGWKARLEHPLVTIQVGTSPQRVPSQPDAPKSPAQKARRPKAPALPFQMNTFHEDQKAAMEKWERVSNEREVWDRAAQHIAKVRDGRGDLDGIDLEMIQKTWGRK